MAKLDLPNVLRRQSLRLRQIATAAIVLFAFGFGFAARHVAEGARPEAPRNDADIEARVKRLETRLAELDAVGEKGVIRAKGFVIEDAEGKVRALLGFEKLNKMEDIPGLSTWHSGWP